MDPLVPLMRHDSSDLNHESSGLARVVYHLNDLEPALDYLKHEVSLVLDNPHSVLAGFQFSLVSFVKVLARTILVKLEIYSAFELLLVSEMRRQFSISDTYTVTYTSEHNFRSTV